VLGFDRLAARQALATILDGKLKFTPVMAADIRTYRFEAQLTLGRILATARQNRVDVPDGISTLFCLDVPIVGTVKAVA
jgi:hypothetical protein